MNINGISGAGMQPNAAGMNAGGQSDPVSADLQKQIEKLKNDLKEISANQEMPTEAKMKKRQEIQKQISDLEIQLRQHQMEAKREERQKKKDESSFDDLMGTKPRKKQDDRQNTGMSAVNMEAMISADKAVKQADTQGSTAKRMEGKANVLESEIKLDGSRGGNTEHKQAELAKTKEAAQKAETSQIDTLVQAGETLKEASKSEKADDKKEDDKNKTDDPADKKEQENTANHAVDGEAPEESDFVYHPVDIRL